MTAVRGMAHYRWRGGNPKPDPERRRANAYASSRRYPERRKAREQVKDAIRRGDFLPAKKRQCVDCGEAAKRYDHPRGYENVLDIEPVCYRCDGLRSRKRGEHRLKGRKRVTPTLKADWFLTGRTLGRVLGSTSRGGDNGEA